MESQDTTLESRKSDQAQALESGKSDQAQTLESEKNDRKNDQAQEENKVDNIEHEQSNRILRVPDPEEWIKKVYKSDSLSIFRPPNYQLNVISAIKKIDPCSTDSISITQFCKLGKICDILHGYTDKVITHILGGDLTQQLQNCHEHSETIIYPTILSNEDSISEIFKKVKNQIHSNLNGPSKASAHYIYVGGFHIMQDVRREMAFHLFNQILLRLNELLAVFQDEIQIVLIGPIVTKPWQKYHKCTQLFLEFTEFTKLCTYSFVERKKKDIKIIDLAKLQTVLYEYIDERRLVKFDAVIKNQISATKELFNAITGRLLQITARKSLAKDNTDGIPELMEQLHPEQIFRNLIKRYLSH